MTDEKHEKYWILFYEIILFISLSLLGVLLWDFMVMIYEFYDQHYN